MCVFINRGLNLGRLAFILIVALSGTVVLLSLGKWQLDRLTWKEAVLDKINSRIIGFPKPLPAKVSEQIDKYLPVLIDGEYGSNYVRVLVSRKHIGAGYRIISPFLIQERKILVDRGFIKIGDPMPSTREGVIKVKGNLHWPEEIDAFTPGPDLNNNIWFARDVQALAEHFGTEPTLVIASEITPSEAKIAPLPINTASIPNDHLQYAITWFSLAIVWTFMSITFLWRTRSKSKGIN